MTKATNDLSTFGKDDADGALAEPRPRLTRSERLEPAPQAELTITQSPPTAARRDLLTACGAFLAVRGTPAMAIEPARRQGAQLAPPLPVFADTADAALIAACDQAYDLEVRYNSTFLGPEAIEDDEDRAEVYMPFLEEQKPLLDRIYTTPATTLEGLRALCRLVLIEDLEFDPREQLESECVNEKLLGALLVSVATVAGLPLQDGDTRLRVALGLPVGEG